MRSLRPDDGKRKGYKAMMQWHGAQPILDTHDRGMAGELEPVWLGSQFVGWAIDERAQRRARSFLKRPAR